MQGSRQQNNILGWVYVLVVLWETYNTTCIYRCHNSTAHARRDSSLVTSNWKSVSASL